MEIVIKTIEFDSSVLLAPFKTLLALAALATVKLSGLTETAQVNTKVDTVTVKQFMTSDMPQREKHRTGLSGRRTGDDLQCADWRSMLES